MPETETITNTDTAGEAVTTQAFDLDGSAVGVTRKRLNSWVAIVDNGFDVDVDVTIQFTTADDEAFTKFITDSDLENITVASGTRDGFGDAQDEPFSYIRFEIDPAADPTSGEVEVTWQRRRLGGD
jgi:hypothetical protein